MSHIPNSSEQEFHNAVNVYLAHARVEGYNEAMQLVRMVSGWLSRQPQAKVAKEIEEWLRNAYATQQKRLQDDPKYSPASHEFHQIDWPFSLKD